jgi:hypothetical protein
MLGAGVVWTPAASAQAPSWPVGRYTLLTVNGQSLPADLPRVDIHHKVRVTGGTLILNSDGTYLCETRAETSYLGLVEQRADTVRSAFATIGGTAVTLTVSAVETDTVATAGQRITWTHETRLSLGPNVYLYSK